MPTTHGGFRSPRDAIRYWLSCTNAGDKSFVAGERHEQDVDEDRDERNQHPTDRNFGKRAVTQQETGSGLGQDRRPEVTVMPIDVGMLVNSPRNGYTY